MPSLKTDRKVKIHFPKIHLSSTERHFSLRQLIVFALVFAGIGGYAIYAILAAPTPQRELRFPASFHIWGGNSATAMQSFDFVVASDASQGNPNQARANGNPQLIALQGSCWDPWNSDWTKRQCHAWTYGGGLTKWPGGTDSLEPNPQGFIRAFSGTQPSTTGVLGTGDYGCRQTDGAGTGFSLHKPDTADFIKKMAYYSWKLGKGAENGWDGVWSDNLVPGNLIHAGWFYGTSCPIVNSEWDIGFKTITNGLRNLGTPYAGGNTAFRASDSTVRAATNAALHEVLQLTINAGPSNFAQLLSEVQAWQAAGPGPKILAVMDMTNTSDTKRMRFGLGLATILGGAYMPYVSSHSEMVKPAEMFYNGKRNYLGLPTAAATRVGDAWKRTFESGVVYANMGSSSVSIDGVTVPAQDAVFRVTSSTTPPPPPPTPAPSVSLSANPTSISSGSSSTLTWSSTNATSCSASGAWSGTKATSGTQSVTPTATSTYNLSCTGSGGSATASATVTVSTPTSSLIWNGDWETGNRDQWGGWEFGGTFDGTPSLSERLQITKGIDGVAPLQGDWFAKLIVAPGDQYGGSSGWRTVGRQGDNQGPGADSRPIPMRNAGYESWWVFAVRVPTGFPGDANIWQVGPEYHQTNSGSCVTGVAPFHFYVYGNDMRVDVSGGRDCGGRDVYIDKRFLSGYAKNAWYVFTYHYKHGIYPNGAFALWGGQNGVNSSVNSIIPETTNIGTMYEFTKNYFIFGIYRAQSGTSTTTAYFDATREFSSESAALSYANSLLGSGTPTPPPPPPPPPSSTAPTITQNIKAGDTLSGIVNWTAATNATNISQISFDMDNNKSLSTVDTTAPYERVLNTANFSNGTHTLGLSVTLTDGTVLWQPYQIGSVTFNNSDTTPPTVSFITPANGATVSGSITVSASASDNVGVTKVEFYLDGVLKSTENLPPYVYNGDNGTLDTTTLSNGTHSIIAKAYDTASNTSSAQISINVQNGDTTPPSTPTNLSATASAYNRVNLSWNASTDNVGVAGYYIVRNGTTIAQSSGTATTYTDSSVSASTTYTYQVIAYDTAGNNSSASNTASVTTPAQPDTTPPSAPSNLTANAVSSTQINLSWNASSDNIGVSSYDIYRNSTKIASVTTTSYGDTNLTANTSYSYYVIARDAAGNSSSPSNTAAATTQPITINVGTLAGIVDSSAGGNIPGRPEVSLSVSGATRTYRATSKGNYYIPELPANTYQVNYDGNLHAPQTLPANISSNTTTVVNVTLQRL